MIFQSIEDEAGKSSVRVAGIFTELHRDMRALFSSKEDGYQFSFSEGFDESLKEDIQALNSYNDAINKDVGATEALASSFGKASMSAKAFADNAKGAAVNVDEYKTLAYQAQVETSAQSKSLSNVKTLITEYNAILSDKANIETKGYKVLSKSGLTQKEFTDAVAKSNPQLATYLTGLQAADGTTKGYVGSLISAKLQTIGLKIETIALNAVVSMSIGLLMSLLSMGLQSAIEAIADALKDPKEALKELDEELSSLQSTIQSTARDFSDLKKNSDEIIPRFAELAKGVDEFGNRLTDANGKMILTDEEYEEFWELNNKIAEMFPDLDVGIDSNGNHILSLSYSVDTLTESLEALVEAERQATNQKIIEGLDSTLDNISKASNAYDKLSDTTNESKDALDSLYNALKNGQSPSKIYKQGDWYDSSTEGARRQFYDELGVTVQKKLVDKKKTDSKGRTRIVQEVEFEYVFDKDKLEDNYKKATVGVDRQLEDIEDREKARWKKLNPIMGAWLQTTDSYSVATDSLQDLLEKVFGNINYGDIGITDGEKLKEYLQNNVIDTLLKASPDVQDAVKRLFLNDGELSINEFESLANKIKEQFGEDNPVYLYVKTNLDNADEMANTVKSFIKDEFDSSVDELSLDDLAIAASDDFWKFLDVPDGTLLSLDELNQKLKEFKEVNNQQTYTLTDLSDALQKLKSKYDIVATAEKEMVDGGLTPSTIKSLADEEEHYLDYLYEENGIVKLNVEAWKERANLEMENSIKAIESGLEALDAERLALENAKVYADDYTGAIEKGAYKQSDHTKAVRENAKSLDDNRKKLALYSSALKSFSSEVDKSTSSLSDIKKLVDILESATKQASYSSIAILELIEQYPELASSIIETADGYKIEESAIKSIISEKAKELKINESLIKSEARLNFLKGVATDKTVATVDEIFKQYGDSISSFDDYTAAWEKYFNRSSQGAQWVEGLREYVDASIYELRRTKEIDNILNDLLYPDEYKYGGNDSGETWFEKQYKLHQHLVAMEQEDEEDYYAWLNSAMNQAYNEGILELDDFRKYQEEVFSGLRSLFKGYLNDVEHEVSMREHFDGEAKNIVALYKTLISKVEAELKAAYASGLDDNDDYVQELLDKLYDYKDKIKDIQDEITDNAKDAVADIIDYVQDMQKQELEDQKDALDKKLDNLKDFYGKQKEMIQDARDAEKYEDEQAEKRKSVTDIQAQLAMLQNDDSAWAQKRKAELNQELADAQKELNEFEKDHAVELALDAIEEAYNAQEAQIQAEMDALDTELNNPELMFNKALTAIQTNTNNLYQEMLAFNRKYGTGNDEDVKDKYEEAYKALLEYKQLNGKDYNGVTLSNATGYKSETGSYDASKQKTTTTTTTTKPATTTATTSTTPELDDATKRKIAAAIWSGNYGWGTGATRSSRLTEVFGANNGIQALVNRGVGKKDGAPGNDYTYLNMRKKFKGYASGTRNATAGWHAIDELGDEYVFTSADGTRYKMLNSGDHVLNAEATDFLYDFANGGQEILEKIIKSAVSGLFDKIVPIINNNDIDMGGITVNGNADAHTVSEIRRAQRDNLKTMLQELQKLNK